MSAEVEEVLIVGGGTAGWLTAAILAAQLRSDSSDSVRITLVESPNIPILGVGEGTWPNLRATLKKIGVSETDFIRECDASFKQGAQFINWMKPVGDTVHQYYHPLNTVVHSSYNFNLSSYWLMGCAEPGVPYDQAVATQARICDLGLAPKQIITPEYEAIQEYSYHLNANKFADFLTRHCVEKLGVKHIKANVKNAQLDNHGYLESVSTDNSLHPSIKADFFVDCSGGKALLIEQAYNIGWHDISHIIFNDTALAVQVPYLDAEQPIASHTLATAQTAGWIWDIGLTSRRGVGHVFSSKHLSDDEAAQQLRDYVGDQADSLELRKIPLRLGYREKFFHKNCVAIGMSASFVEPLEASAIYLFDAAANMIADQFPRSRENMGYVERKFNASFKMRMERTIDFIKLHYCISNRRDTDYWIENCSQHSIPDTLQWRLKHWQTQIPSKYDFDFAWEPFNLDSYLYVLYGMNFITDLSGSRSSFSQTQAATEMFKQIDQLSEKLIEKLPKQRELLDKVRDYGMSKI